MAKAKAVYEGVIQKVITNGRHGPYAVASCSVLNCTVTFSLRPPVWGEGDVPEPGTFVTLSRIIKKRAGWRAMRVAYVTPSAN